MQIRRASANDAYILAKAILIAERAHVTKGILEVILGGTEDKCFIHHLSTTQIPHLFHYSYYLIAEEGGFPIGSLGGYSSRISGYRSLQKAIPEVDQKLNFPIRHKSFGTGIKNTFLFAREIDGVWVIDSVATLPAHRGKGVALKLLNQILEIGERQGYLKAQVNMYIGNEPALNLYSKLGFEIIEEKPCKRFKINFGHGGF